MTRVFVVLLCLCAFGCAIPANSQSTNRLQMQTANYKIIIDGTPQTTLTYYSWGKSGDSTQPDLIIRNGSFDYDGSGGNEVFTFKNGAYTYEIYHHVIGTEFTPEYSLSVYKDDKRILNEEATVFSIN